MPCTNGILWNLKHLFLAHTASLLWPMPTAVKSVTHTGLSREERDILQEARQEIEKAEETRGFRGTHRGCK